jgi:hypothetical protein
VLCLIRSVAAVLKVRYPPLWLLLVSVSFVDDLPAQTLSGRLLDADSGNPIANATIELLEDGNSVTVASALTNQDGFFRFTSRTGNPVRLRASRIGFQTTTSQLLTFDGGEDLEIEFRLSARAVLLEPLTVVTEARPWWESIRPRRVWGLYERMERYGRTGFARFITPEDLELLRGAPAWSILSSPIGFGIRADIAPRGPVTRSITIRGPFGRCNPVYFVDGIPFRAEEWVTHATIENLADQNRIEGIELFSPWYLPSEYAVQLRFGEGCVVAVWTRLPP